MNDERKKALERLRSQFANASDSLRLEFLVEFESEMLLYDCAISEIRTKLEILDKESTLLRRSKRCISSLSSRLKTPAAIAEKLNRKGLPLTLESVKSLYDVAGVRVLCPFLDDVYAVRDMLLKQDDLTLIRERDYIKEPKETGYRSLHLVLAVPVFLSSGKVYVPVEVQLRTIAMDFWASLEHRMRYKKEVPDAPEIRSDLKETAKRIHETDLHMMALRDAIEELVQAEE